MSLLDRIKTSLYHRRIRTYLQKMGTKVVLPVNQSFDIGILLLLDKNKNIDDYIAFSKWLKARDRNVDILVYNPFKEEWPNASLNIINQVDNDWLGIPKNDKVLEFCNKKIDLLINFDHLADRTLEYVSSISKASFKIGLSESSFKAYDVLLQPSNKADTTKIKDVKNLVNLISQ